MPPLMPPPGVAPPGLPPGLAGMMGGGGPPGGGLPGLGAPPGLGGPPPVPPPPIGGPASAGQNPMQTQQLLSMLAGIGLQNLLQTLGKFAKTISGPSGRGQQAQMRSPLGTVPLGAGDMMAQRGLPASGAPLMPLVGAAGAGVPPGVAPPGM
jgi:hypothetical protein